MINQYNAHVVRRFNEGDIVKHFKREFVTNPSNEYLYKILNFAIDSETGQDLVVYQALYPDKETHQYLCYVRPYKDFISQVDQAKYPNIHQKYRFEKYIN